MEAPCDGTDCILVVLPTGPSPRASGAYPTLLAVLLTPDDDRRAPCAGVADGLNEPAGVDVVMMGSGRMTSVVEPLLLPSRPPL